MTAIRYVTEGQMARKTGMKALGYAFPEENEIWLQKGMPKKLELEVREHEFEHIQKGEEGPFWGALIGVGASLLGGALSSNSASKASKAQERAAKESIAFQRESRDLALAYQKPYRDASYTATAALMDMTGLSRGKPSRVAAPRPVFSPRGGGMLGSGSGVYGKIFNAAYNARQGAGSVGSASEPEVPNLADYPEYSFQTDPGYEFRMSEGNRALERGAAARGGLLSGGFARKALRYAQDYASNEYQNVYNRIASIAGFGQVATNTGAGVIMNTGANVGNAMTNAGEARASGYVAQGNAWSNAINQIGQMDWSKVFGGSQLPTSVEV